MVQSDPKFHTKVMKYTVQVNLLRVLTDFCCIQIYDAGDFSVLTEMPPPKKEKWLGGQFLSPDRVLVWTISGKSYLYQLPNQ